MLSAYRGRSPQSFLIDYTCDKCMISFNTKKEKKNHMRSKHAI